MAFLKMKEDKLEKIIVAEWRLMNLLQQDLPRIERIIQGQRLAELQTLRNENLAEALSLSQRSLELAPNVPNFLDTKAEILLRLGSFAEAQQANDEARKYAEDEGLLKSLNERAEKITAKLREQAGKR